MGTLKAIVILGIVIFVGVIIVIEMGVALWNLSPLTSVGFFASVHPQKLSNKIIQKLTINKL